jgi:hypothetical protein
MEKKTLLIGLVVVVILYYVLFSSDSETVVKPTKPKAANNAAITKPANVSNNNPKASAVSAGSATGVVSAVLNPKTRNKLLIGEKLKKDERLISGNQKYHITMQGDCNFVSYNTEKSSPIWASNTWKKDDNCYAVMQEDNNLVVYDKSNTALWSSETYNKGINKTAYALLSDDGMFGIYDKSNARLWASSKNT